jgi:hypothetical protein
MPDYEIELTLTTGQNQAIIRSVIVEDARTPEIAKALGIDELLKWADEEGSPVPSAALEYWQNCRHNGNVMMYEVLSTLEANWQLSFIIKETSAATNVAVVTPPARPSRPQSRPAAHNGTAAPRQPLDLKQMLAQQLDMLNERQKELAAERKRIDEEWADNTGSIADIRSYLMTSAIRRRRRRKEVTTTSEKEGM